jgi:hypothetical protein
MADEKKDELVSITFNLSIENIAWLKKVNETLERKSVSNTLNFILNNIRERKNKGMIYE